MTDNARLHGSTFALDALVLVSDAPPAKLGVSEAMSDCPDALRDIMRANSAALESAGADALGLA